MVTIIIIIIIITVSTILGHLKRGFVGKGEQVSVQKDSEFGLRISKVTGLLVILR